MTYNPKYLDNFPGQYPSITATSVGDFFNRAIGISIPEFQRPYSWGEDEVIDLLNDIRNSFESKPWFIGIIYWKTDLGKSAQSNINEWRSIIDGQQRLTTIILLLRELSLMSFWAPSVLETHSGSWIKNNSSLNNPTIQNACIEDLHKAIAEMQNELIGLAVLYKTANIVRRGSDNKLKLSGELEATFNSYIIEDVTNSSDYNALQFFNESDKHPSNKNLFANRNTIKETLLNFALEAAFKDTQNTFENVKLFLSNFQSALYYNLWLIEVPLSRSADIRIFEAINDRGLPLDFVSKFRFKTLSDTKVAGLANAEAKWQLIYRNHGITQSNIFNTTKNKPDAKFKPGDYLAQFLLSLGKDLTDDDSRLEELVMMVQTSKTNPTFLHSKLSSLLDDLAISVDFSDSKLFNHIQLNKDVRLIALLQYNLYLHTYNIQTRVVQFFINRFIVPHLKNVNPSLLLEIIWRLNNFLFAINHLSNLKPNVLRTVLVHWINKYKNITTLDSLKKALEAFEDQGNVITVNSLFERVELINLDITGQAQKQFLLQSLHLTDIYSLSAINVHNTRFDQSVEHWLPQKNVKWKAFQSLNVGEITDEFDRFGSSLNLKGLDNFNSRLEEIQELDKVRKAVTEVLGNLFLCDKTKNSSLGNSDHALKKLKVNWNYFFTKDITKGNTLKDCDKWGIEEICLRTAHLEKIFSNIATFKM